MIEYIKGILVKATLQRAVIDVNGMGYCLSIPLSTYEKLPPLGNEILLYVTSVIRENSHKLFGFITQNERDLFEMACEVSGIGPKVALALIGHLESSHFEAAITHGNIPLLSKIPGIGKKTAERLVMGMRDKMEIRLKNSLNTPSLGGKNILFNDATNALIHLGYHSLKAQKAIEKAFLTFKNSPTLSELIGAALKGI